MEWHFPSDVHTIEFHEGRERAPHLEQDDHRARLLKTAELIDALPSVDVGCRNQISDLGCGDGGLLQLLQEKGYPCWGYDFSPVNEAGWEERSVEAGVLDVFSSPEFDHPRVGPVLGDVVVMTEVLEHLKDPQHVLSSLFVQRLYWDVRYIVASSPRFETADSHGDCHQWAWDWDGYEKLFKDAGWTVVEHVAVDWSQIIVVE